MLISRVMEQIPFIKMHGLGNDFVILDGRKTPIQLGEAALRAIADRNRGVGYDQLIVLEPSSDATVFMRIFNADGSEAEACGNATRCVAHLMMEKADARDTVIETVAGLLPAHRDSAGVVIVDMGKPALGWAAIPLAQECDTLHVPLAAGPLSDAVAVNMGNPHAVFFVDDADAIDLEKWGPILETDPLLPARANISIASLMPGGDIRLRVWERGVGITLACGSAACATIVSAIRRGLVQQRATLHMNGGPLQMSWEENGHVLMGGAIATSFTGTLSESLLKGAA